MTKEMKMKLGDEDLEAIAGGTSRRVDGYMYWEDGDHSKPPTFVTQEGYDKYIEEGGDPAHMDSTYIEFGKVTG